MKMKKLISCFVLQVLVYAVVACLCAGYSTASQDYRHTPINLHAKDILPKALLKGENYKIADEVKNHGLRSLDRGEHCRTDDPHCGA